MFIAPDRRLESSNRGESARRDQMRIRSLLSSWSRRRVSRLRQRRDINDRDISRRRAAETADKVA